MSPPFFLIVLLSISAIVAQAVVPRSKTFRFVLNSDYGPYATEYDASYRYIYITNFEEANMPFQLFFYNTTPDAFIFGMKMSRPRYESQDYWVWDANQKNPVRENATLTFGSDGNLVIADVDGRVAWETGTANKGVVGIELLRNGNLVLTDKQGRYVWQSFNSPTNTLLAGASLRAAGVNKLVSRNEDGSPGIYSLVLEKSRLAAYLASKNSPKPLLYEIQLEISEIGSNFEGPIDRVQFITGPLTPQAYEYESNYLVYAGNTSSPRFIGQPAKFNTTLSFLRVRSDGNIIVKSFYDFVERGGWEDTYRAFDEEDSFPDCDACPTESECRLPSKCGSLGVCEDNECVACPTPKGLLGWTKSCAPPKLPSCKAGSQAVDYYKVVGVVHFTYPLTQGDGPTKLADCRAKCSKDCGCLGFFYRELSSKCLLVPELGPLNKVSNQTHVAYIKMAAK